jgi:hypothetical protein
MGNEMNRHLLAAWFCVGLLCPDFSGAQSPRVAGFVVDSTTGLPLAGAIVSLADSANKTLAQRAADRAGFFSMARAPSGTRISVIRIGYRPKSIALSHVSGDTSLEIRISRLPPILNAIQVTDQSLCPGSTDRGGAFQVWEQVRAGLWAALLARRSTVASATTLEYRRRLSPTDGSIREHSEEIRRGEAAKPFGPAVDAETLARDGYMKEDSTGRVYFGLDEEVLLDESFAATHCFRLQRPDTARGRIIGLAFEPVEGRDTLVELRGVIWLEANPLGLREIDFEYTGLERAAARAHSGGRVEFQTVSAGVPLATSWLLRIPLLVSSAAGIGTPQTESVRGRRGRSDLRLAEIREVGGELLDAESPGGGRFRGPPTGIAGRITPDASRAVRRVLVTILGTTDTAVTDGSGSFELQPLPPGKYTVAVVDTALGLYVEPRRTQVVAEVSRGRITPVEVSLPPLDHLAAAVCRKNREDTSGAHLFGRIASVSSSGSGPPTLVAVWAKATDTLGFAQYGHVDRDGNFRLCGIPRGQPVILRLAVGEFAADTTVAIDENFLTSFTWNAKLVPRANSSRTRVIQGSVVDSSNRALAAVQVSTPHGSTVLTDERGRFRLRVSATSDVTIDFRRLGLTPTRYSFAEGSDTSLTIVMLPSAVQLDEVRVSERPTASARLAGFEQRLRDRRTGTSDAVFITADEIEQRKPDLTTSMMSEVPGLRIVRVGPNDYAVFSIARGKGSSCPATFYLDGQRIPDITINDIVRPDELAGIEVYPSSIAAPAQYRPMNGGCAVVLLWRKGG